ncbi:MAG TPA: UdgX family uracil-DNA binding protein [Actinomycetota bacterium]|nr:UdgX family uracil-DNA binding protein [Actinomycetota bacterium]
MTAEDFLPESGSLIALRTAAAHCRGCSLYRNATQTVFGEGPASAEVVLVGEQPGDQEDRQGRPFVGPAGKVLDRALSDADIDRRKVFITNVVKHFKFQPRGKRRIHKRPSAEEVRACAPWFRAELEAIKPTALVALGATAAQDLFGRSFRVTKERGKRLDSDLAPVVMATIHPSAILRAEYEDREQEYERFVADLRILAGELRKAS